MAQHDGRFAVPAQVAARLAALQARLESELDLGALDQDALLTLLLTLGLDAMDAPEVAAPEVVAPRLRLVRG